MNWRLVLDAQDAGGARAGAWNMAVDEALAGSVAAGGPPVLRLYTWCPPCLSFGRNQPARGRFDRELARKRGIDIVRRPTGGLAVYHDQEITYAAAVPAGLLGGPRETYRAINRALVRGLRRVGIDAALSPGSRPAALASAEDPCFHAAAEGEVVVAGRKLVGSAQRRDRNTILQHGSILLDGDQCAVLELQGLPPASTGATSLRRLLGRAADVDCVRAAIAAGFEDECGTRLAPGGLSRAEHERAHALAAQYRSDEWTWRR